MKKFTFRKLIPALLLLISFPAAAGAEPSVGPPDLIFHNGVIYTADERDSVFTALAVTGGRIVFVGSDREGLALAGPDTERLDLEGRMVLPGFFDTHMHAPGPWLPEIYDFDLSGVYDQEQTLAVIKKAVEDNPDRESYFGFGFATNAFSGDEAGRGPRRERLDAISSDKPILIIANDGHMIWMNSKAFEAAGLTAASPDPQGGVIERDEATGALWGTLKDMAMVLAPKVRPEPGKMLHAVRKFQYAMNSLGYTSILTLPASGDIVYVPWYELEELDRNRELTLKVKGGLVIDNTDDLDRKIEEIKAAKARYDSEFLKLICAKFFADGVINTRTAYVLEPYVDLPASLGVPLWTQERLNESFRRINAEAGVQVHVHAIGDAAVRSALDAFEYSRRLIGAGDFRNTITHLQLVHPDDWPRFRELGAVASTQPYWHFKEPGYWGPEEYAAIGPLAELQYPLKSLHQAGARLTFSSDSPVTMWPNPFMALQVGVTRNMAGAWEFELPDITDIDDPRYLLNQAERLPLKEMIRGFTANSAYATFCERETGSLEPGKAADLIIIDRNLFETAPLEIERTRVLKTYVNGRQVYDSEAPPAYDLSSVSK